MFWRKAFGLATVAVLISFGCAVEASAQTLPTQTINLSVQNVQPTANLSFTPGTNAVFDQKFGWAAGTVTFTLKLTQAVPVILTLNEVVQSFSPTERTASISITANGKPVVSNFLDSNLGYHNVSWTIPASLVQAGNNAIQVVSPQTTNANHDGLYYKSATVAQGVFPPITQASTQVPSDIPGTAPNADLQTAAVFAWQEMIALSWPASVGQREDPDLGRAFGATPIGSDTRYGAVVWETLRHKAELFPGGPIQPQYGPTTAPPGYPTKVVSGKLAPNLPNPIPANYDYGYNSDPLYIYKNGPLGPGMPIPWNNLDENNQIGFDKMYAGVDASGNKQEILYQAKGNLTEYIYAASRGWWQNSLYSNSSSSFGAAQTATINFMAQNQYPPPPAPAYGSPTNPGSYISFPPGAIEIKTAWRQLTQDEIDNSLYRFHTAPVRYYTSETAFKDAGANTANPNEVWGLVGLHIIQKTPSAQAFIFATFEQTDNLLTPDGKCVEDLNGNLTGNLPAGTPATTPNIYTNVSNNGFNVVEASGNLFTGNYPTLQDQQNALFAQLQQYQPKGDTTPPTPAQIKSALFYQNYSSAVKVPQGSVRVNKRMHDIPSTIADVNAAAHQAILNYNIANSNQITTKSPGPTANCPDYPAGTLVSPWNYYKLVNVQWIPFDKSQIGSSPNTQPATYYLANSVVETDYGLQHFRGNQQNNLSVKVWNGSALVNLLDEVGTTTSLANGLNTDFQYYYPSGTPDNQKSINKLQVKNFNNVYYPTGTNMGRGVNIGGCMGCHGVAQSQGNDFSFILYYGGQADPDPRGAPLTESLFLKKSRLYLKP